MAIAETTKNGSAKVTGFNQQAITAPCALERYMRKHLDDRKNPDPDAVANRLGLHPVVVGDDRSDAVVNHHGLQRAAVPKRPALHVVNMLLWQNVLGFTIKNEQPVEMVGESS